MGIIFVVHLAILALYILLLLWDMLIKHSRSLLYRLFVLIGFTGMIVGYLFTHMQAFVFSVVNLKYGRFTHQYFVFCFIIAILYIGVFGLFWLYSFFRLIGESHYWDGIYGARHRDQFYYFFSGYKDNAGAWIYDLVLVMGDFIIAVIIGTAFFEPLWQTIIILIVVCVVFLYFIAVRPWISPWLNFLEFVMYLLYIVLIVIFLVMAINDNNKCWDCDGREGSLCWLFIIMFFALFLIGTLGLILGALYYACCGTKRAGVVVNQQALQQEQELNLIQQQQVMQQNQAQQALQNNYYTADANRLQNINL